MGKVENNFQVLIMGMQLPEETSKRIAGPISIIALGELAKLDLEGLSKKMRSSNGIIAKYERL